jgi:large subunit ribosomal protein L22
MSAVTAVLRNCRVSARKARLVADQIRGKQVQAALDLLRLSPKRVARPFEKLVRSAVANAEAKNDRDKAGIDVDNLVVSRVVVDEGASLWRIRARAQGRANWIQRRTAHFTVELEER